MKHLVIAVSLDSSLELLEKYAEVVVLDKKPVAGIDKAYDTVYIRSHFSHPNTLPQNFRTEIDELIRNAKRNNPGIQCIDNMDTVDKIVQFEDKWFQYQHFQDFMPQTQLYNGHDLSSIDRPVFKKRLSSRGTGVTWDQDDVIGQASGWIVQESLDISEELRIYIIRNTVYSIGAVRQSKTTQQSTQATSSRSLTKDEIAFASEISEKASNLDIVGLDVIRTTDGQLKLLEVNRSPGFAAFEKLTNINLADELYKA